MTVDNESMGFEEACRLVADEAPDIVGYGKFDPDIEADILTLKGNPYPTYTFATHLVEIEIDEALGSLALARVWAAHDAGTIVNPVGSEGQIEGGVAQGLGQAVMEKGGARERLCRQPALPRLPAARRQGRAARYRVHLRGQL